MAKNTTRQWVLAKRPIGDGRAIVPQLRCRAPLHFLHPFELCAGKYLTPGLLQDLAAR